MHFMRLLLLGCLLLSGSFAVLAQEKEAPKAQHGPAEEKAIARIRQLGGLALEVAQNDPSMEVSYQQIDGKITDEEMALLKDLKDLVSLNLRGKDVTDEQLAPLAGITSLKRLHLERTKITDKGTPNLKGLVNLEYLNLYGTDVSDASLPNFEDMKKLKHLYLWQTKVTDAGAAKLQKALPHLDINRGQDLLKVEAKKPETKAKDDKGKKEEKKKEEKK